MSARARHNCTGTDCTVFLNCVRIEQLNRIKLIYNSILFTKEIEIYSITMSEDSEHMPKLQHIYAGETSIATNSSLPEALKGKVQF